MPTLPTTVLSYPDETALSIIIRLAAANHYPKASWVTELCGAPLPALLGSRLALQTLSELSGLGLEFLMPRAHLELSPQRSRIPRVSYFGSELPQSALASGIRVCPKCLAAAPYLRALWGIDLCRVCPIHETPLVDRCPVRLCGSPIGADYKDSKIWVCRCGYKLWEGAEGAKFPGMAAFWRSAQKRMLGEAAPFAGPPAALSEAETLADRVGLSGALLALTARALRRDTLGDALGDFREHKTDEILLEQEKALELLHDWPVNFIAYVDEIMRRPSRDAEILQHAADQLHPFFDWDLPPRLGFLADIVAGSVEARSRQLFGSFLGSAYSEGDERRFLPIKDAAVRLGMRDAEVREILVVQRLAPGSLTGSSRRDLVVVSKPEADEILEDVRRHGGKIEMHAEYLSFSEAGLVAGALGAKLRNLVLGLRCGAVQFFFEDGRRQSFATMRIAHVSLSEFLLSAWEVDPQALIAFNNAAKFMVLDHGTLEHLIGEELVASTGQRGVPDDRKVLLKSMVDFKRKHRTLSRIGAVHIYSRSEVERRTKAAGVRLISGPGRIALIALSEGLRRLDWS